MVCPTYSGGTEYCLFRHVIMLEVFTLTVLVGQPSTRRMEQSCRLDGGALLPLLVIVFLLLLLYKNNHLAFKNLLHILGQLSDSIFLYHSGYQIGESDQKYRQRNHRSYNTRYCDLRMKSCNPYTAK